ncbi:hypothetical protein EYF80_038173 [Liparis tanakae]|uniref:Uncharacterized protein n=1 Tax=Liparis tanakae TaxID=230148 RepID=A0A4Z2GDF0_9TELE|nr:hypothetical protein EYF80_038173 [Liparis tanakae]
MKTIVAASLQEISLKTDVLSQREEEIPSLDSIKPTEYTLQERNFGGAARWDVNGVTATEWATGGQEVRRSGGQEIIASIADSELVLSPSPRKPKAKP